MNRPQKEDFTDWCHTCDDGHITSTGKVKQRYRRGGWAGENVTVYETCPDCNGKKIRFYVKEYYIALEEFMEKQCPES